jgi:hypothetical protein
VAGGMFKGTSSFAFAMTREDWERATLDLAKQTLKGTPILIQNTSY